MPVSRTPGCKRPPCGPRALALFLYFSSPRSEPSRVATKLKPCKQPIPAAQHLGLFPGSPSCQPLRPLLAESLWSYFSGCPFIHSFIPFFVFGVDAQKSLRRFLRGPRRQVRSAHARPPRAGESGTEAARQSPSPPGNQVWAEEVPQHGGSARPSFNPVAFLVGGAEQSRAERSSQKSDGERPETQPAAGSRAGEATRGPASPPAPSGRGATRHFRFRPGPGTALHCGSPLSLSFSLSRPSWRLHLVSLRSARGALIHPGLQLLNAPVCLCRRLGPSRARGSKMVAAKKTVSRAEGGSRGGGGRGGAGVPRGRLARAPGGQGGSPELPSGRGRPDGVEVSRPWARRKSRWSRSTRGCSW